MLQQSDFNGTPYEKVKLEPCKDAVFCFELILIAVAYKTAAVWPHTSHLINHPSKTSKT